MRYEPNLDKQVFVAYSWIDGKPTAVKVLGRDQINAQLYCQANGYELGITEQSKLTIVREQILRGDLAHAIEALEMIAGYKQCLDNTMSNQDIAREVLSTLNEYRTKSE